MRAKLALLVLCGFVAASCSSKNKDGYAGQESMIYGGGVNISQTAPTAVPNQNVKPQGVNVAQNKVVAPKQYNDQPLAPARAGVIVRRIAVPEKVVALTFDDGPHGRLTPQVLDILNKYGAKGTFFVLGSNAASHPSILKRMVNEGHEVANHTWNHAYLSKVSRETAASQLTRTNNVIRNACGVTPTIMRPPGGYINNDVAQWANKEYGFKTIMWDVDTNDWRKPGVQAVVSRAVNGAKPGSIILVHDIHASTVAAIEDIVKGLQNRGYQLVTVSELIRRGNAGAPPMPASPESTPKEPVLIPVEPSSPAAVSAY